MFDQTLSKAIEKRECVACKHYGKTVEQSPCDDCYYRVELGDNFEPIDDTVVFAERLEARKDE